MKLQAPLPFVVAVPIWVVPSNTVTVLLTAAVPLSVSVLSLVTPSPTAPLSLENEVMVGAAGAWGVVGGGGGELAVSIVTVSTDDAALVVPAASIAFAVKL